MPFGLNKNWLKKSDKAGLAQFADQLNQSRAATKEARKSRFNRHEVSKTRKYHPNSKEACREKIRKYEELRDAPGISEFRKGLHQRKVDYWINQEKKCPSHDAITKAKKKIRADLEELFAAESHHQNTDSSEGLFTAFRRKVKIYASAPLYIKALELGRRSLKFSKHPRDRIKLEWEIIKVKVVVKWLKQEDWLNKQF